MIVFEPPDIAGRGWVPHCQLAEQGQVGAHQHSVVPWLIFVQGRTGDN